jgi:hypothetical protein
MARSRERIFANLSNFGENFAESSAENETNPAIQYQHGTRISDTNTSFSIMINIRSPQENISFERLSSIFPAPWALNRQVIYSHMPRFERPTR